MKRILTAAQMKQADRNTIETMGVPSLVLMAVSYTHLTLPTTPYV